MAKLCNHGSVIGTVNYITKAKRYMSDGVILCNTGFGWKLAGKVKPGVDPVTAYANASQRLADRLAAAPALRAYIRALHDMAGMDNRWKLHAAVSMMPDDCDGVWSEVCDGCGDNVHADVDEVAALCALYRAAIAAKAEAMAESA